MGEPPVKRAIIFAGSPRTSPITNSIIPTIINLDRLIIIPPSKITIPKIREYWPMLCSGDKLELMRYLKLLPKYGNTNKIKTTNPIKIHKTLELLLLLPITIFSFLRLIRLNPLLNDFYRSV